MTIFGLAVGGGLGALARYGVAGLVSTRSRSPFPAGTLTVNVVGSFLLGALVGLTLSGRVPDSALVWAGTGFLGAFTTFSTFVYETLQLVEDQAWKYAMWNVLASGPLSFAAAAIGYALMS
ncbi:MAG: fluoride efflux transporter CrcB [Acidimicrobiia bacterium]